MKNKVFLASSLLCLSTSVALGVTVDFSKEVGEVKRLNGVCGWTRLAGTKYHSFDYLLKDLDIPKARFHDAVLDNPGIQLLDVSRIFPLFHLDADDPRNYDFRASDDLLRKVKEAGVEIEFRLGESIEHQGIRRYNCMIPRDCAKWAEICAHIVRHYNCGWADGFHWNIKDWAIWEEPNTVPELFDPGDEPYRGAYEKYYYPLYETTARRLKREFPDIRLSGSQAGASVPEHLRGFIAFCAEKKLPLDILTFGNYRRDPDDVFANVVDFRKCLDRHGFKDTKIQVGEWHWAPISWKGHGSWPDQESVDAWQQDVIGPQSGAYVAAVLVRGQDYPVDQMAYYAVGTSTMHWWSLIGEFGRLYPSWYAMKAFAEVARLKHRVACPSRFDGNFFALATKDGDKGRMLISVLMQDNRPEVEIKGGMIPVSVRCYDGLAKLTAIDDWQWNGGKLTLPRNYSNSAFWLVDLKRDDGSMTPKARQTVKKTDLARFKAMGLNMNYAVDFLFREEFCPLRCGIHDVYRECCCALVWEQGQPMPVYTHSDGRPTIDIYTTEDSDEVEILFPDKDGKKVAPSPFKGTGRRILIRTLCTNFVRTGA